MFGFTNEEIVTRGTFWTIWRCPTTVFMQVRGYLDNARSNEWQQALQHEYDKKYPRFAAMEVTEVDPQTTFQHRFKAAMWIRDTFKIIEQGALLTGARPGPLVVSRTLLRLIGLDNIVLHVDPADFQAHLDAFRQGNRR
jgi:hypothetical protein